jgi:hypothetical protein
MLKKIQVFLVAMAMASTGTGSTMKWEEMKWTVAQGKTGQYPYTLRIRHLPSAFPRQRYPQRLNIFWSVAEANASGYPTASESQRLSAFEDRLIAAVESDRSAILVVVMTGRREREFVFHTADPDEFVRRLTNMPQERAPYPIEIHRNKDAQWRYYDKELGRLSGS